MLLTSVFVVSLYTGFSYGVIHDSYTGEPVSEDQLEFYETNSLIDTCTINIVSCDKNDWRRVDGTCNNLENPAAGTFNSPMVRILPAHFYEGYKARKAESGEELPLAREVRVTLLKHQKSSHEDLNNNVPGFAAFLYTDVGSVHDTENLLLKTTYCCQNEHLNDYACTPNFVPANDPVFKDTDVRCMNSTRPLTYQDYNCTRDKVPSPLKKATTSFDCSQIYNAKNKGDKVLRSFENGQLTVEEAYGILFPPNGPTASCPSNVKPNETMCFENYFATLLPVSLLSVWFVRYHNYIASELAKLNPCWDDERLFQTARDINIAFYNQIAFYEWKTAVQGRDNLVKAGIIRKDNGFIDLYDDKKSPEVTVELAFVMRYFHLMQESRTMLYDSYGNFIEEFKTFATNFRMGLIAQHMVPFTQSLFRAPCHGGEGSVDYDLANSAFPGFQKGIDAPAGDINKNRNFGLAPYIDYVHHFLGIKINSFEDLKTAGLMSDEKIELIKSLYDHERDLDLMAGLWCEENVEGGNVPLTLAEILNDSMLRAMQGDRHWYERPNRPHAFTKEQLREIRKASLASLMCTVADGVVEIPKKCFYKISDTNPVVSCCKIKKINFKAWTDDSCKVNSTSY